MARQQSKKALARRIWRTLPLFDSDQGQDDVVKKARTSQPGPRDLLLHIYWSAGLEAHALGAAAASTPYLDQRRALVELQELEMDCQDRAARTLLTQSGISLPGAPRDQRKDDGERQRAA